MSNRFVLNENILSPRAPSMISPQEAKVRGLQLCMFLIRPGQIQRYLHVDAWTRTAWNVCPNIKPTCTIETQTGVQVKNPVTH